MDWNEILNNTALLQILLVIGILIVTFFIGRLVKSIIQKIARRQKLNSLPFTRALLKSIARSVTLLLLTLAIIIGKRFFDTTPLVDEFITVVGKLLITLTIGVWVYHLVEIPGIWFDSILNKDGKGGSAMLSPILKRTLHVVVIGLVLAQVFTIVSNKPITPIIASLGIVGAAIALAAQDSFKNFFGSFVLAGDKPFELGERVVIDGFDGPVENIGLWSTRIRTLEGHLVSIPNGVLVNKTIQNIGKREYIRRIGTITITYGTPPDKIEEALSITKKLLDNHEGMNPEFPPRVFFKDLSAYSLDIMFIYWYFPPEYWDYMAFTEKFNLELVKQFNAAGIDFAFPTQTVHIENSNSLPDDIN